MHTPRQAVKYDLATSVCQPTRSPAELARWPLPEKPDNVDNMPKFEHLRHLPPIPLTQPRPFLLVVAPLRSNVNLSRMVRLAGCSGIDEIIHCGGGKIDREIARDAADVVKLSTPRSLPPVLDKLRSQGYRCVGLEQTTHSQSIYTYQFTHQTALLIRSERECLAQEQLTRL